MPEPSFVARGLMRARIARVMLSNERLWRIGGGRRLGCSKAVGTCACARRTRHAAKASTTSTIGPARNMFLQSALWVRLPRTPSLQWLSQGPVTTSLSGLLRIFDASRRDVTDGLTGRPTQTPQPPSSPRTTTLAALAHHNGPENSRTLLGSFAKERLRTDGTDDGVCRIASFATIDCTSMNFEK